MASDPLSPDELDELSDALLEPGSGREFFDASMLDGFLIGVLLQPQPVAASAWLSVVFDAREGEPLIPGDPDRARCVIELVMRHHDGLAAHIAAREPFDPIVYDVRDEDGTSIEVCGGYFGLLLWASGFLNALNFFPALLARHGNDEIVERAMTDILRHLGTDPSYMSDAARARLLEEQPFEDFDDAIRRLVLAVLRIADVTQPPPLRAPDQRRLS